MHSFFVYGTLMDPDVLANVIGRRATPDELAPATLAGWQRRGVRAADFPMVLPSPGDSVEGLLAGPFGEDEAVRLVHFEHGYYGLKQVEVQTAAGAVPCWLFAPLPGALEPGGPWDLQSWHAQGKSRFLARVGNRRMTPAATELAEARRVLHTAVQKQG